MRMGVVARLDMPMAIKLARNVIEFLIENGVEVSIDTSLADKVPEFKDLARDLKEMDVDIILTLGGDGTILRTQSFIEGKKIPLLGVNMGTVGFLTEIDPKNVFQELEEVLQGNYITEERTQLDVYHHGKLPSALNEVVMITREPAKMLHIQILVDDEVVKELRADGIIVATPSGSTAYSMSAGGPIVDPRVEAFIIVPICPFKLSARPLVASDESEIRIKLLKKGKKAIAVVDGQFKEEINYMEELVFRKSKNKAYFVRLTKNFYKKVREKLIEGGITPSKE